ncbi:BAH-domain-containing protein [Hesseltinella vesiculosa]|uniref:BAH-domain-containing protein n=1 Tax=Hesseltinella vesiculosa TaxID=101127 RepID=A0A1X2G7Y3_9FUNG|nr:BAH-domain-containing protein [Hesseltinella vesiculosa]
MALNSVKLKNGLTVHVNDHVYLAPEHLGEPYYIGRVMEFCPGSDGMEARIAWYNRPKDVMNPQHYDPALLLATLNSDMNPVSCIQGKCKVIHRYYIPKDQFNTYRRTPDQFYYSQLYDRYMQRIFDLLPCETIQNVPKDILDALTKRYQFIIVEQGKVRELTSAPRACTGCQSWCSSTDSVKCAGCQKFFHMTCVSPPLIRKPSKGFAWQCGTCSKLALDDQSKANPPDPRIIRSSLPSTRRTTRSRSQQHTSNTTPASATTPATPTPSVMNGAITKPTKPKLDLFSDPCQITTTNLWPFRYYGIHTTIKDIEDAEDRIYPLATGRIGARYQANVPETLSPDDWYSDHAVEILSPPLDPKQLDSQQKLKRGRPIRPREENDRDPAMAIERGTDETVTLLFKQPTQLDDEALNTYMTEVRALPSPISSTSPDLYDIALHLLQVNKGDTQTALAQFKEWTDFPYCTSWSYDEIKAFEHSISNHGHDLHAMKQYLTSKTMPEIVRFFYQWKKSNRYKSVYSHWTEVYRPTKQLKSWNRSLFDCLIDRRQLKDEHFVNALVNNNIASSPSPLSTSNTPHIGMSTSPKTNGHRAHGDDDADYDDDASRVTPRPRPVPPSKKNLPSATSSRSVRTSSRISTLNSRPTYYESDVDDDESSDDGAFTLDIPPKTSSTTKAMTNGSSVPMDVVETEDDVDVDPNVIPTSAHFTPFCANCRATQSTQWRRCPGDLNRKRVVFDKVLCQDCGIYWLKYGLMRSVTCSAPSTSPQPSRSGSPVKSDPSNGKRALPEPDQALETKRPKKEENMMCAVCFGMLYARRFISCQSCYMDVHDDCYGIDRPRNPNWVCDTCQNKRRPRISYEYECRLCGQAAEAHLDPLKPTSGFYWTHITCALFFAETKFVDTSSLKPVEFVGAIPNSCRDKTCEVCLAAGVGACVTCSHEGCGRTFHAHCAVQSPESYSVGFVLSPPTSDDEPVVAEGLFHKRSPAGVMKPTIYCSDHRPDKSAYHFYGLQTRTVHARSWIEVYAQMYKSIDPESTPAMRRYTAWLKRNDVPTDLYPPYYTQKCNEPALV